MGLKPSKVEAKNYYHLEVPVLDDTDQVLTKLNESFTILSGILSVGTILPVFGPLCTALKDVVDDVKEIGTKIKDIVSTGLRVIQLSRIIQNINDNIRSLNQEIQDIVNARLEPLIKLVLQLKELLQNFKTDGWFWRYLRIARVNYEAVQMNKDIDYILDEVRDIIRNAQHSELIGLQKKQHEKLISMFEKVFENKSDNYFQFYPLETNIKKRLDEFNDKGYTTSQAYLMIEKDQDECYHIAQQAGVTKQMFNKELLLISTAISDLQKDIQFIGKNMNEGMKKISGSESYFSIFWSIPHTTVKYDLYHQLSHHKKLNYFNQLFQSMENELISQNRYPLRLTNNGDDVLESVKDKGTLSLVITATGFGYSPLSNAQDTSSETLIAYFNDIPQGKLPLFVFVCAKYGSMKLAERILNETLVPHVIGLNQELDGCNSQVLFDVIIPTIANLHSSKTIVESNDILSYLNKLTKKLSFSNISFHVPSRHVNLGIVLKEVFHPSQNCFNKIENFDTRVVETNLFNNNGICTLNYFNMEFSEFEKELIAMILEEMANGHNYFAIRNRTMKENMFSCRAVALGICKQLFFRDGSNELLCDINCSGVYRITDLDQLTDISNGRDDSQSERLVIWVDIDEPTLEVFDWLGSLHNSNRVLFTTRLSQDELKLFNKNHIAFHDINVGRRWKAHEDDNDNIDDVGRRIQIDDVLHQEIKLQAMNDREEVIDLRSRYDSQILIDQIKQCLPEACEIAFLIDGDYGWTFLRISISSVGVLHSLRDRILNGLFENEVTSSLETIKLPSRQLEMKKKMMKKKTQMIQIKVDRTQFAETYEDSILCLNQLTRHQRMILEECQGCDLVHIKAPAGAGKTFVALHLMISLLRDHPNAKVLFCANNRALGIFIGKWLCEHLGLGSTEQRELLSRICILCVCASSPSTQTNVVYDDGVKKETSLERLCFEIENYEVVLRCENLSFDTKLDLIIVDEAHHLYKFPHLVSIIDNYHSKKWLLLSDFSQAIDSNIEFKKNCKDVFMTEVVRSSQRIVTASLGFIVGDVSGYSTGDITCHQDSKGPLIDVVMFEKPSEDKEEEETKLFEEYAKQTVKSLLSVISYYPGLDLNNRVVIIVPDVQFHKKLFGPLQSQLLEKWVNGKSVKLINAQTAAGSLRSYSRRNEQSILFDTVAEVDGLERLIVCCVGLDQFPIKNDPNPQETRSRFYRAFTRAHMNVCVINHFIAGGWLQFMTTLKPPPKVEEFDQKKAIECIDMESASRTLDSCLDLDGEEGIVEGRDEPTQNPADERPNRILTMILPALQSLVPTNQTSVKASPTGQESGCDTLPDVGTVSSNKVQTKSVNLTPKPNVLKTVQNIYNTTAVKVMATNDVFEGLAFNPMKPITADDDSRLLGWELVRFDCNQVEADAILKELAEGTALLCPDVIHKSCLSLSFVDIEFKIQRLVIRITGSDIDTLDVRTTPPSPSVQYEYNSRMGNSTIGPYETLKELIDAISDNTSHALKFDHTEERSVSKESIYFLDDPPLPAIYTYTDPTTNVTYEMPRVPDHEGWLNKQSDWLKDWRRRYFILDKGKLFFGKDDHSNPHGMIDLAQCMTVKSAELKAHKRHAFEVSTVDTCFLMFADSEKEKDDWIGAIGRAIVRCSSTYGDHE